MSRALTKRALKVSAQIGAVPVPRAVADAAFERFCATGELPEYLPAASLVVARAERGGQPLSPLSSRPHEYVLALTDAMAKAHATAVGGIAQPPQPREVWLVHQYLFTEAVDRPGLVRQAAREALRLEVRRGGDVTQAQFLQDRGLPKFGSLGLHLLGFPTRLARPPYAAQAKRLFARYDALRRRLVQELPAWAEPAATAVLGFRQYGELPLGPLLRAVVLANAEMEALWDHAHGRDVQARMAAFDALHGADPGGAAHALARLQSLACARYASGVGCAPAGDGDHDVIARDVREIAGTLQVDGPEHHADEHPLQVETMLQLLTAWDPDRVDRPTGHDPGQGRFRNHAEVLQRCYEIFDAGVVRTARRDAVLGGVPRPRAARLAGRAGGAAGANGPSRAGRGRRRASR